MANPMDKVPFAGAPQQDLMLDVLRQAQQNPSIFEEQIKRNNPKGYQMACQIRNSQNPREAILRLAQERGVNPNILKMFGII